MREEKLPPLILDHVGNNFAVRCVRCEKVFVLSGHLHKRGRVCPHCKGSMAYVGSDKKSILAHLVEEE